jgi:hypothetical protein
VKLSRKESARLKREARRQERKADSDNEDLAADAPAFKASALSCQGFSELCVLLACGEADQNLEAVAGPAVKHVCPTVGFSCQMGSQSIVPSLLSDQCHGNVAQAKLDDARFAAMFSDPAYALDPTDPRFAQSAGTQELAAAVARRKQKQRGSTRTEPAEAFKVLPSGRYKPSGDSGKAASESAQLRAMVAALKNRGNKMPKQKGPHPSKASKAVGL